MGKSAYYLVTFGCLCMINSAAAVDNLEMRIGGLDHRGLYNVDESLAGKCIPTDNGQPAEVPNSSNFIVADGSISCSSGTVPSDRVNSLPNATETVSTNDITFTITTPQLRVYTLWCVIGKHVVSRCRSAVMYKLETMETDSGFDCKLDLGVDNNFQRPNKVQWLRNGDEKNPLAARSLSETDFADGKSGAYSIKSVSFPLELTPEMAVAGEYECRFTTGQKQILSSKFLTLTKFLLTKSLTLAAPEHVSLTFFPDKEQFTDGKSVALSCLFKGYPEPDIQWFLDGKPIDYEPTKTVNLGVTNSTIKIKELEDSVHRGNYSCIATNDIGEDEVAKVLHVRDKLAALWPILGILVQVILLAICIAIGEKIRKKKHAEKQRKRELGAEETTTRT